MRIRLAYRTALLAMFLTLGMSAQSTLLDAQTLGLEPGDTPSEPPPPACEDGVVLDDGSAETGYGWVPSVVDGRFVQTFQTGAFRSRSLQTVCICWTRTRDDEDLEFNVDVYRDTGKGPELEPIASIPATISGVPEFPDSAFVEVDVSGHGVRLPAPIAHIGVSWNPSVDGFFFVCADHSSGTEQVDGQFIDDRAKEWTSVLEARDPIFQEHRAMLIRAWADPEAVGPVLGWFEVSILSFVLASIGWLRLRASGCSPALLTRHLCPLTRTRR